MRTYAEVGPVSDLQFSEHDCSFSEHDCSFSASMPMAPLRMVRIVDCDGQPVWQGFIMSERQTGARSFSFTAKALGSV